MKTLLITLLTLITLSTSAATLNMPGKNPIKIEIKQVSSQIQFGNQLAVSVLYQKNVTIKNTTLEVYKVIALSTTNKKLKKVKYIYRTGDRYFLMTSKKGTVGYIKL